MGVAINESCSYTLTSAKVDVVCDVAMTSTSDVLTPELRDLLHNQSIDNMCCYLIFIRSMGRIRVCKIKDLSALVKNAENLVWYARNSNLHT